MSTCLNAGLRSMSLRQRTAMDKMLPEKNKINIIFVSHVHTAMSLEVLSAILIFRLAQLFHKFPPNPNKEVTSRRRREVHFCLLALSPH